VLSTSSHYGWALCGYWDELRPRNGFRTRCIARKDGASVYLFNRRPNKSEDPEAILYFACGAVVQFRVAPDPVDAVEVVYQERDKIEGAVSRLVNLHGEVQEAHGYFDMTLTHATPSLVISSFRFTKE